MKMMRMMFYMLCTGHVIFLRTSLIVFNRAASIAPYGSIVGFMAVSIMGLILGEQTAFITRN